MTLSRRVFSESLIAYQKFDVLFPVDKFLALQGQACLKINFSFVGAMSASLGKRSLKVLRCT